MNVIIDKMDGCDAIGRTEFDAPEIDNVVRIPGMPLLPGVVLKVRVTSADVMDLIAEPVV